MIKFLVLYEYFWSLSSDDHEVFVCIIIRGKNKPIIEVKREGKRLLIDLLINNIFSKLILKRTKVDSAYSLWEMLLSGVIPQGSILGPLLFNICDMFFEMPKNIDFAGYDADNNTTYHIFFKYHIDEVLEIFKGH